MSSLPPMPGPVNKNLDLGKNKPFSRRGIRLHDPAAASIGALTPSQQAKEANQQAIETDPVLGGGATPQNRVARYGTGGFNGQ
jgi:hypothetical protein